MIISLIKRIIICFTRRLYIVRPYNIIYPLSYGAMCIHEGSYNCFACCKYHAFLQFIKDTVKEDHYSDRSIRTPLGYMRWVDDIKRL